jgi:hypothetical protein
VIVSSARQERILRATFIECLTARQIVPGVTECEGACRREGRRYASHASLSSGTTARNDAHVCCQLFPFLLLVYETHRVGRWIFDYGMNFSNYKFVGYEYLLMLVFVALQIIVGAAFLLGAWLGRHHDLYHQIENVLAGVGCSIGILVFDFVLQYAL